MVGLFKFKLVALLSVFVYYQSRLMQYSDSLYFQWFWTVLLVMSDTHKLVLPSSLYSKVTLACIGVT